MKIVVGAEIVIEDPTEEIIQYADKHLWVDNPEYEKRKRMGLYFGNIPKKICLYYVNEMFLVLPIGFWDDIKGFITKNDNVTTKLADEKRFCFKCAVELYDYQRKAVIAMALAKRGILQSPAGSGKTQMGIALATSLGYKTLWLTHTKDLLEQSYRRASMYMPEEWLGKITDGKIDIGCGITFATIQTLSKQDPDRFEYEFNTVIVDECHRASGTPTQISQFSKVLNKLAARHKYGLSATVHRNDGLIKCTYSLLGSVKYIVSDEAVKDRIMQVKIYRRSLQTEPSDMYLDGAGMMVYTKLIEYLCGDTLRNIEIVKDLKENKGQSCLILSDRVAHLEFLKKLLKDDDNSVLINGRTPKKEREKAIEDMRNGKKKYLFATFSLAKEGLDIPCLSRLFLTAPHSDYAVIVQAVGRIARTAEGKNDPVCYDYVDENIGYLVRKYKERCTHYRKARCLF